MYWCLILKFSLGKLFCNNDVMVGFKLLREKLTPLSIVFQNCTLVYNSEKQFDLYGTLEPCGPRCVV